MPSASVAGSSRALRAIANTRSFDGNSRAHGFHFHLQPCLTFVFIRRKAKRDVPRRLRQRRGGAVEINRAPKMVLLPQTQDEVFFLQHLRLGGGCNLARKKQRVRISVSEWLQRLVPPQELVVELRKLKPVIEMKPRLELLFR